METSQDVITTATAILAGIGAIVFGAQKAIKSWTADRGDIQKLGIDVELYTRMNSELARLSKVNQQQEEEIKELRDKCNSISEQFSQFRLDNLLKDREIMELRQHLAECELRIKELQHLEQQ